MGAHSAPRGRASQSRTRSARPAGSLAAKVFVLYWWIYAAMIIQSGMSDHLTIGYYLYSLLFWIMLPVAGICAVVAAERVAAMSTNEPPRWAYVILALCYLSPVAITAAAGIRLKGQRPSWWANRPIEQAATEVFILCLVWTIMLSALMLGRAIFHGRLRERFWFCLPHWMTDSAG